MLRFSLVFAISLFTHVARAQDCEWVVKWDTIPSGFALVADTSGQVYRIHPDTIYCRYYTKVCVGKVGFGGYFDPVYYLHPEGASVDLVLFYRKGVGPQFVTN